MLEKELLPVAVKSGISINDFWNYSLDEIKLLLETFRDSQEVRAKEVILNNYNLASMISGFICKALAGKQLPRISELYPEFEEEENTAMIQNYVKQFKQFANMHNKGVK